MSADSEATPAAEVDTPLEERAPDRLAPAGSPEVRSLLALAVAVVVIAAVYVAQDVLIPIVLAMMLSFVLSPLVDRIEHLGVPRAPSVVFMVLLAFCVIVVAGMLVARQASALAADAPRYAAAIQEKFRGLEVLANSRLPGLTQAPGSTLGLAGALLAPVLGPLETTVLVIVIAIFMLIGRDDLRDRFIRLAGARDIQRTTAALNDAGGRLSRYFVSQLAVNTMFGTVIGIGLAVIGIPSAALWGVLAGLLRFIPYIGPILAAVPPIVLAAAVEPGWRSVFEVALLFVLVEPFTGYLIEPLLYGHSTGLAPISVILAAIFWTWMWGLVGLLISTPLTLCLVVLGRHVKSLEFLDVLLGDRPPLTPADTFYQRMLADDPDDALERAESMLEEDSLLDYYDDVVLEALKQAARDEARGVIPAERAAELSRTMMRLFGELEDHLDATGSSTDTGPARGDAVATPRTVACIAGRGPFDDAVTAMLAQLLTRRGMRARTIGHAAISRERIARTGVSDAAFIVLSCLDMSGSALHLKHLVRRLRQHAGHAKIIVGLWPAPAEADVDTIRLNAIEADGHVSSLREAVDACVVSMTPPS